MLYPVAVWTENGLYSATIPDLPGVITESDSMEELTFNIEEAALGWMEAEIDDGREIPKPSLITNYAKQRDYEGCFWMFIDITSQSNH